MGKKIIILFGLIVVFGLGIWVTKYYYTRFDTKVEEQSQVLLEKIKTVAKLVTVEGYFSEVYDYKDYWGYNLSPFRKKALVRVKAKVSVGYDLTKMTMKADSKTKTIQISNLPDPTIISIDHDLDYYDITEGTFNSFSAADYNKVNEQAKKYIREQAGESELFIAAEKQGNQILEIVKFMVEGAGWNLEYTPKVELEKTMVDTLLQELDF